jgi:hypothetical protein
MSIRKITNLAFLLFALALTLITLILVYPVMFAGTF